MPTQPGVSVPSPDAPLDGHRTPTSEGARAAAAFVSKIRRIHLGPTTLWAAVLRRVALAFLAFLPMAAVGTLVHECGHAVAALALGGHPVFHYGSTGVVGETPQPEWVFALGGPLTNMAIGTFGLAWLRTRPAAWLPALLLALFWSRQPFDLAGMIAVRGILGATPTSGDEAFLGAALGVGPWPVSVLAGVVGGAACVWAVAMAPGPWRLPVLTGGVAGCLAGFVAWYGWIGPALLP